MMATGMLSLLEARLVGVHHLSLFCGTHTVQVILFFREILNLSQRKLP